MTNREYWEKRFERLSKEQFDKVERSNRSLKEIYAYTLREIQKEVMAWYERYATENGMSLADARKQLDTEDLRAFRMTLKEYTRLAKVQQLPKAYQRMLEQASIRKRLDRSQMLYIDLVHYVEALAKRQSNSLESLLKEVYEDTYYQAAYETQMMKGAYETFAAVPKATVETAISSPWAEDGKDFSRRIWENKTKLINTLQNEITRTLMAGEGTTLLSGRIASRFNVSFANARRLAETETAYVQEKARMDTWTKLGVQQYQIVATLDNKTSPTCRYMDGKVFDRKDAKVGVTYPPFHCYCRTTTIPYIKGITDDDTTRAARDPVTGKSVTVDGQLTYPEWKQQYVSTGARSVSQYQKDEKEAAKYYKKIRQRTDDVEKISLHTGFSKRFIQCVKSHIFFRKHLISGELSYFSADYDIAVAWQRLINGKPASRDLLLLRHEHLESAVERRYNLTYEQAHALAERKYAWDTVVNQMFPEDGGMENVSLSEIIKREEG